jgi:hypothetical protein
LLLKFFEVEARFPEDAREIPVPAVSYVAQQVRVPAEEWAAYDWSGRAIKRHRMEIRGAFGFRECTEEDQAQLAEWLAVELCGVELNRDRLAEAVVARCRKDRLEPPAPDRSPGWWARRSAPSRNGSARQPWAGCRRRANGESVEQIQPDLIIPTGRRKGQAPSVASIYRALAEHEKKEAYPEAVAQAHADFADLRDADDIPRPRRVRFRRPDDPLTAEEADLRQRLQTQPHPNAETSTREP